MGTHTGNVLTLANSIIGVSVLAMPFCFKQCGIFLAILMLLFSNIITRLACHYLMKSAILEKRKNFEMLAFRVFGPTGKLIVELCIIGFMLGTCVAYFVIIGDLGPGILGPAFGFQQPVALRPSVLIGMAVFVILPLGLLKNVDSLSAICAVTIAFYFCLVLKVMGEAINHLVALDWIDKVYYWRPSGILQCIPIFSMSLSCQTQLFEIFDSLPSNPLDRMNEVVKSAINMVTLFYVSVGFLGYIAYCDQTFSGNLMMNFSPTVTSDVIKIGFLLSVAMSFPLVIFPCRASIHSLFFSKGYEHAYTGSAHISETRFKCITLVIVTASLVTGLLIPNIEIVLGLVGSTIGVIICVIIPGIIFTSLSSRNNNETLVAKFLVCIGLVIMVLGTYANLYATEEVISGPSKSIVPIEKDGTPVPKILKNVEIKDDTLRGINDVGELAALPELKPKLKDKVVGSNAIGNKEDNKIQPIAVDAQEIKEIKKEPPVPEEPEVAPERAKAPLLIDPVVKHDTKKEPPLPQEPVEKPDRNKEPPRAQQQSVIVPEAKKAIPVAPDIDIVLEGKEEPPALKEPLSNNVAPKEPLKIPEGKQEHSVPDKPIIPEVKKEPLDALEPKDGRDVKVGIFKDKKVFQETRNEPPHPNESLIMAKKSENYINTVDNVKNVPKDSQIKELTIGENNRVNVHQEIVKENLIEKIKEHEEAQRKLNEEGVKLLKEIKDYVNITNDSLKIVNVKTGIVSDIKTSKNLANELVVNDVKKKTLEEENGLVMKMAKGIPLPLAVKGQQELFAKNKENVIDTKVENKVVDKHGIERDLLANDNELREKRDVEAILKQDPVRDYTDNIPLSKTNHPLFVKQLNHTSSEKSGVELPNAIHNETENMKTLSNMEAENCVKKDSNEPESAVNEILIEESKVDTLIKSPSFLSNVNPVLNTSPQLLSSEMNKDGVIPEMPKKRDLKSVSTDELSDYNRK